MEVLHTKDMTKAQITHTYCTFCVYRRFVASYEYWGCGLEESKLEELCSYHQAIKKEAANA